MKKQALLRCTVFVSVALYCSTAFAQSPEYWSAATRAMTEASGETLYNDFEQLQEFNRRFLSLPGTDEVALPYEQPVKIQDALLRHAALVEYIEQSTAQKLGVFIDPLVNAYTSGYDRSSRDATAASIATEIGYEGTKLVASSYLAGVTSATSLVFNPRPGKLAADLKGQGLGILESGLKMWVAGTIQDNVLRPAALTQLSNALQNSPAVLALEDATNEQLSKVLKFQESLQRLESQKTEAASDEDPPDLSSSQAFVRDISTAESSEDLERIAEQLAEDVYGPPEEQDILESLLEDAKEVVAGTSRVVSAANEVNKLLVTAGVPVSPEVHKALHTATAVNGVAANLVDGKFFSAALGVASIFGPKRPSAEELRFKAIMGALGRIESGVVKLLDGQRRLLEGQATILQKLDQLQWTLDKGFHDLEASLQESTEVILRAVFSPDERALGACRISAASVNEIMFPESAETINIFADPNGAGLPDRVLTSWMENPPDAHTKLNYLIQRHGENLARCNEALTQFLGGLQSRRGIDEYFKLTRLEQLPQSKAKTEEELNEQKNVERQRAFAKDYREKVFAPQSQYYNERMVARLQEIGFDTSTSERAAKYLAFRPPLSLQPNWVEDSFDLEAPWTERSRLSDVSAEALDQFERYFTPAIYDEVYDPLSAATVSYAADSLIALHSVFGLLGPAPELLRGSEDRLPLSANPDFEEDALRLLLQALQMVEILRAQQAIFDGTSLVELLWGDMMSLDHERWAEAQMHVLDSNALARENFGRYLLYRILTPETEGTLSLYRWHLSSNDLNQLQQYLDEAFGDRIQVRLSCDTRSSKDDGTCRDVKGNRTLTPYTAALSWSDPKDPSKQSQFEIRLPGHQDLEARRFKKTPTSVRTQALHDRIRKAVASYQMEESIAAALSDELESSAERITALYTYKTNLERGHLQPTRP